MNENRLVGVCTFDDGGKECGHAAECHVYGCVSASINTLCSKQLGYFSALDSFRPHVK